MSPKRKYFFWCLTPLLILITVYYSWGFNRSTAGDSSAPPKEKNKAPISISFDEHLLLFQSKVILGALTYLQENKSRFGYSDLSVNGIIHEVKRQFRNSTFKISNGNPSSSTTGIMRLSHAQKLRLSQRKFILASTQILDFDKEAGEILTELKNLATAPEASELDRNLTNILQKTEFSEKERATLSEHLGWFGALLIYDRTKDESRKLSLKKSVIAPAIVTFKSFTLCLIFGSGLGGSVYCHTLDICIPSFNQKNRP